MTKPLIQQLAERVGWSVDHLTASNSLKLLVELCAYLDEQAADKPEPPTALTELRTIAGATGANAEPPGEDGVCPNCGRVAYDAETRPVDFCVEVSGYWPKSFDGDSCAERTIANLRTQLKAAEAGLHRAWSALSKRQVWVVERRDIGKRAWNTESARVSTPSNRLRREWVGVDGALYRWRRYTPEKPE